MQMTLRNLADGVKTVLQSIGISGGRSQVYEQTV
jgi:hypothetical protein